MGVSLNKVAIMDTKGKLVGLLMDTDGKPLLVPGDQITWR